MNAPSLRELAQALKSDVSGRNSVSVPAHSANDRSLRLRSKGAWRFIVYPLRATIGADAAITSANGLGCRYIV
jgi:hypothetical protein